MVLIMKQQSKNCGSVQLIYLWEWKVEEKNEGESPTGD